MLHCHDSEFNHKNAFSGSTKNFFLQIECSKNNAAKIKRPRKTQGDLFILWFYSTESGDPNYCKFHEFSPYVCKGVNRSKNLHPIPPKNLDAVGF